METIRKAVIRNGVVENVIVVGDDDFEIEGCELVASDVAGIGYTYSGEEFTPPAVNINYWRQVKLEQAEMLRLMKMNEGFIFQFPNAVGTVQLRNEVDQSNVNGVATSATILNAQGVTDPVLMFRDRENVIHTMTPLQAMAFGLAVADFVTQQYAGKWTVTATIKDIQDPEEMKAFDVTAAWPE